MTKIVEVDSDGAETANVIDISESEAYCVMEEATCEIGNEKAVPCNILNITKEINTNNVDFSIIH